MNLIDSLLTSTLRLDSPVAQSLEAISNGLVHPYLDAGGPVVFWVDPNIALGVATVTAFDRETGLGLESWSIRWGASQNFGQLIRRQTSRSPVPLAHRLLPWRPPAIPPQGEVTP